MAKPQRKSGAGRRTATEAGTAPEVGQENRNGLERQIGDSDQISRLIIAENMKHNAKIDAPNRATVAAVLRDWFTARLKGGEPFRASATVGQRGR